MIKTLFVKSTFSVTREKLKPNKEQSDKLWSGISNIPKEDLIYEKEYEYSDCSVDGEKLSIDLNKALKSLDDDGFKVVSITPVTSGAHNFELWADKPYAYGFSYTEGMLVCAEKA